MKLIYNFTLGILSMLFAFQAQAQMLVEDFAYTAGDSISAKGWAVISGGSTNLIKAVSPGLTYSGYRGSGIGNAIFLNTTGQDITRNTLPDSITAGNIFSAFMFNIDTAQSTGDYFFALLPKTSTTAFTARVFIKRSSGGYFKVGVSKGATPNLETVTYSTDSFAMGTTYLAVVKYQFNAGGTTNDSVKVFVFANGFSKTEPTQATVQNLGAVGAGNTDATNLGRVSLRQGTAASAPRLFFDGLTVDNSWEGALGLLKPVSNLTFANTGSSSAAITWNKPSNYVDSTQTTLVFVKQASAITLGTPTLSALGYTADTNFASANPSTYQHDAAAKCVYKGDGSTVNIGNLTSGTMYYVTTFVVSDLDTSYAAGVNAFGATQSTVVPPAALNNIAVSSAPITSSQMGFTWQKGNYVDSTSTILVYVKKSTVLNVGLPNYNLLTINADSNWTAASKYENDTAARCVYKGDGDGVYVSGLDANTTYYAYAFVVRNQDSAWSASVNVSRATKSAPSLPVTLLAGNSSLYTVANITWTLPVGYSTANSTVLVFAKPDVAINTGNSTMAANKYTANAVLGAGSKFENDTLATCIYNGDLATVALRGLLNTKSYHLTAYVVSSTDSVYSVAANAVFIQSFAKPVAVHSLTFNGLTAATARISWIKDSTYANTKYSTLVFVKAGNAITDSIPTRTATAYFASPVMGTGTKYQFDNNASCVFKADTNFVNISGLVNTNTYYASVWVIEDTDSVYSEVAKTSGVTQPPPALSAIADINTINQTTGNPDSINKYVRLTGIVYGFNQRTNGLTFMMRDNTGGITVSSTNKSFGYTVKEGDSILVQGIVSSNRGLLQVSTIDTLIFIASGKSIKQPRLVSILNESTEHDFVKIENVSFVTTPTGTNWPGASQTIRVVKNGTTDTLNLRYIATSALSGKPLPTTKAFSIIGMGAQISSSMVSPFTFDGYNVIPRVVEDIMEYDTLAKFNLSTPNNNASVSLVDTLSGTVNFTWEKAIELPIVAAATYTWMFDTVGGSFTSPIFTLNTAAHDTFIKIPQKTFVQLLLQKGVGLGQSYYGNWQVKASTSSFTKEAVQSFNVQMVNSLNTGLLNLATLEFDVFPNPANEVVTISTKESKFMVNVTDAIGREVLTHQSLNAQTTINTQGLKAGVYWLKVQNGAGFSVKKLVIQ